jgi:DNA-binding NtrC family response regulator
MMNREIIVIVDDDPNVTEALAAALESDSRLVVTCSDIEAAKIIVERMAVDLLLTDVRISPPFGFEGLDLIRYVSSRSPRTVVAAMTGAPSRELIKEARSRGAAEVFAKPFSIDSVELLLTRAQEVA